MNGFDLTDEQSAFVEAVRDFSARECGTRAQRDALTGNGEHPHNEELYAKVAELGWLGVTIDEEYGGSGGGMVDLCLFLEAISHGQLPIGGFPVTAISAGPYEKFGSPAQKEDVLRGIVNGKVEAIAMSEPEAGSDVGALRCKAERNNGSYVINGQKTWISEAHFAEHILLVCRTDASGPKHEGLSMIQIPQGHRGDGDPQHRDDGRSRRQRRVLRGRRGPRREPRRASRAGPGCSSWRASTRSASSSPRSRWASRSAPSTTRWPT